MNICNMRNETFKFLTQQSIKTIVTVVTETIEKNWFISEVKSAWEFQG